LWHRKPGYLGKICPGYQQSWKQWLHKAVLLIWHKFHTKKKLLIIIEDYKPIRRKSIIWCFWILPNGLTDLQLSKELFPKL
jgi:hypothetical protein